MEKREGGCKKNKEEGRGMEKKEGGREGKREGRKKGRERGRGEGMGQSGQKDKGGGRIRGS